MGGLEDEDVHLIVGERAAWLDALAPRFRAFGAEPPPALDEIYRGFAHDPAMLAALVETAPAVVSFHFGLPRAYMQLGRDRAAARALERARALSDGAQRQRYAAKLAALRAGGS